MYKYKYVKTRGDSFFDVSEDHREIIDKYSKEGWRFVSAIPVDFSLHGVIETFDLVFEKECEE